VSQQIKFRFDGNGGIIIYISPNINGTLRQGSYSSVEFLTFLNGCLLNFVNNAVGDDGVTALTTSIASIIASYNDFGHVIYTITYQAGFAPDPINDILSITFPSTANTRTSYQLQQRMGYGKIINPMVYGGFIPIEIYQVVTPGDEGVATTGDRPVDLVPTRYLMLRSSLGSGSAFTPNIRGKENIQKGGNIIAKIPTDVGNIGYGERYLYTNGDNLSPETMFTYNGGYINNFDLYFTRPHDDSPIDFDGYAFDVTIAVSAACLQ
jgi:hypothetical protein